MNKSEVNRNLVLIPISEVTKRTGLSRTTIYARLNPDSRQFDPDFPKQIHLGRSTVRWLENEVNRWIELHIERARSL